MGIQKYDTGVARRHTIQPLTHRVRVNSPVRINNNCVRVRDTTLPRSTGIVVLPDPQPPEFSFEILGKWSVSANDRHSVPFEQAKQCNKSLGLLRRYDAIEESKLFVIAELYRSRGRRDLSNTF